MHRGGYHKYHYNKDMTWPQFKELFVARYYSHETPAATLINLMNSKPNEDENLASYAARLMTTLSSKWQNMTTDQIITSTVLG